VGRSCDGGRAGARWRGNSGGVHHHPCSLIGAGYAAFRFTSCADRGRAERRVTLDPRTPAPRSAVRPVRLRAQDGNFETRLRRLPASRARCLSRLASSLRRGQVLPAAGASTASGRDWRQPVNRNVGRCVYPPRPATASFPASITLHESALGGKEKRNIVLVGEMSSLLLSCPRKRASSNHGDSLATGSPHSRGRQARGMSQPRACTA
jgi:hypothetical protein